MDADVYGPSAPTMLGVDGDRVRRRQAAAAGGLGSQGDVDRFLVDEGSPRSGAGRCILRRPPDGQTSPGVRSRAAGRAGRRPAAGTGDIHLTMVRSSPSTASCWLDTQRSRSSRAPHRHVRQDRDAHPRRHREHGLLPRPLDGEPIRFSAGRGQERGGASACRCSPKSHRYGVREGGDAGLAGRPKRRRPGRESFRADAKALMPGLSRPSFPEDSGTARAAK